MTHARNKQSRICSTCGRFESETTAGATVTYCWWCNDRAADLREVPP